MDGTLEHWQYDSFITRFDDKTIEPAYVTFSLNSDGKVDRVTMKAVSPLADLQLRLPGSVVHASQLDLVRVRNVLQTGTVQLARSTAMRTRHQVVSRPTHAVIFNGDCARPVFCGYASGCEGSEAKPQPAQPGQPTQPAQPSQAAQPTQATAAAAGKPNSDACRPQGGESPNGSLPPASRGLRAVST